MKKIVVTGATRGLGLEAVRILSKSFPPSEFVEIYLCGRSLSSANSAIASIAAVSSNIKILPLVLDNSDKNSIAAAAQDTGKIDTLVANAGIFRGFPDEEILNVNLVGTLDVVNAFLGQGVKRIVCVSSQLGGLDNNIAQEEVRKRIRAANSLQEIVECSRVIKGEVAYNLSKALLNAAVRVIASERKDVEIVSVCPGWCATDMGGARAPRMAAQGGQSIVNIAMAAHLVSGSFYNCDGGLRNY